MKRLSFLESSLDDVRAFPETARRATGYQLGQVQRGLDPEDSKPMPSVESGVREVRMRDNPALFGSYSSRPVRKPSTCASSPPLTHAFQKKKPGPG